MSRKYAHVGLHLTVVAPVLLGALGALLYSSAPGRAAPPLGDTPAGPAPCLGERLVEAWPAPADGSATGMDVPEIPSPVASDL
ncbi:MAG: hypothetical protein P8102_11225 [Gammaproteobacteria bacterium]